MLKALKSKKFFRANKARSFLSRNVRIFVILVLVVVGVGGTLVLFTNRDQALAVPPMIQIPSLMSCYSGNISGCPVTDSSGWTWNVVGTGPSSFMGTRWSVTREGWECTVQCMNGAVGHPPTSGDGSTMTFAEAGSNGNFVASNISDFNSNRDSWDQVYAFYTSAVTVANGQAFWTICEPQQFQPGVVSQMVATVGSAVEYDLTSGPVEITDNFKATEETPSWSNFSSTNATFTPSLLGPFSTIKSNYDSPDWPNATYPLFTLPSPPSPNPNPASLTFSYSDYSGNVWKSTTFRSINRGGYFYGVAALTGSNNESDIIKMDWKTGAIHSSEMAYVKFQPYVESNVQQTGQKGTYLAGTLGTYRTFDPGDTVTNRVVARATNSIDKADNLTPTNYAETPSTAGWFNDNIWPNGNMPLRVCVDVYGPYQQPQAQNLNAAPAGAPKIDNMTKCQDFQRPGTGAGDYRDFTFTAPTLPGYYYFMERIEKGTAATEGQTADTNRLIISRWTSKFNPTTRGQDEKFVVRFQPVAESHLIGNRDSQDNTSKGSIFDCNEHAQNVYLGNFPPILDITKTPPTPIALADLPPSKVTCENVKDKVYIAATDKRDISENVVGRLYTTEKSWLKDAEGNYEVVNFRVKLYGPFATPESRQPGSPAAGKTIQTVLYQPIGTGTPPFVSAYPQPAAMTDLIPANNGPKWDLANNPEDLHYEVTFKQDANGGTTGALTTTTLRLAPGFYTAVVEVLRGDNGVLSTPTTPASGSGNLFTGNSDSYNLPLSSTYNYIFYSAWGDPYESLSIPLPVYAWSERYNNRNSNYMEYKVGDVVNDRIWIKGFDPSEWVIPRPGQDPVWQQKKDALERDMVTHTALNFDGKGTNFYGYDPASSISGIGAKFLPGYFAADTKADIKVTLYGPYDDEPLDNTRETHCQIYDPADEEDMASKMVAKVWSLPSMDFRNGTILNPGFTIEERGWYVFFIEFPGGDRVFPFTSDCSDNNEKFLADGIDIKKPSLKTTIKPAGKVPTVVHDDVNITGEEGSVLANSTVILTLYRRIGDTYSLENDEKLCSVKFTVSKTGQFSTKSYLNADGTVKPDNSPTGAPNPNRCFAQTKGQYYWIEEFRRPGNPGLPYQPIPSTPNPGESVYIDEDKPSITTKAQPEAFVGELFGDTAIVSGIPAGSTKKYLVVVRAFGPQAADGSAPVCEEPFFTSEIIRVTENGEYPTNKTKVDKPGNVYWIEYLYEDENDNGVIDEGEKLVDSGKCGQPHETTRITTTTTTTPESGAFVRNILTAIGMGSAVAVLTWFFTNKNALAVRRK